MSKQRSNYDELHDHYHKLLSTKSGTRYERLAAFVFKYLEQNTTVIHDLKLLGESGVSHQIDVTIEHKGKKQRTLLECKDFDLSGDKVGLSIIRDFYGVIADINPNKAYVVTCNGFTRDAEKYAKSKNIGLVVLRKFRESDWDGLIRQITLHLTPVVLLQLSINMEFKQDDVWEKINNDLKTIGMEGLKGISPEKPVFFNTPEGRFQANDFIKRNLKNLVSPSSGIFEHDIDVSNITFEINNLGSVELKQLKIFYEILHGEEEIIEIGGNRIAKLLLQGIGSDSKVIWDDSLCKFRVDEKTREVF